jgi:predicted  nucleic acid-binding Zn ribbon protein
MHVARLTFDLSAESDREQALHGMYGFLGALTQSGRILGREHATVEQDGRWHAFVMLPDAGSLDGAPTDPGLTAAYEHLVQTAVDTTIEVLGESPGTAPACVCPGRTWQMLRTNYLEMDSPLRCGDCFQPVPLYRIPTSESGELYELLGWETDYKACDTLYMNSATGEDFGLREMTAIDSSLAERGREICRWIEKATGTPTYYFLFRYLSVEEVIGEDDYLCPACGGAWKLQEKLRGHIEFKCDPCRLVSMTTG